MLMHIKEAEISPQKLKLTGLPNKAGELNIEITEQGALILNDIKISSMRMLKGIAKIIVDAEGNTQSIKLKELLLETEEE